MRLFRLGPILVPALMAGACSPPQPAAPPTSLATGAARQAVAYTSGRADVALGARTFHLALQPSRLYPSPPAVVDLEFGDPQTGASLTIQAPPRPGVVPTSEEAILSLTLPASGERVSATSMDGECSITLERADEAGTAGSFRCSGLRPELGNGPPVLATGTFDAAAAGGASTTAPPPPPGSPTGVAIEGEARVRLAGAHHDRLSLELQPGAIFVDGGAMQLFYEGTDGSQLGIGGTPFTGTRDTSTLLTVALTLRDGTDVASAAGECSVRVRRPGPGSVRGRFSCRRVATTSGPVSLSGTFDADGLGRSF